MAVTNFYHLAAELRVCARTGSERVNAKFYSDQLVEFTIRSALDEARDEGYQQGLNDGSTATINDLEMYLKKIRTIRVEGK